MPTTHLLVTISPLCVRHLPAPPLGGVGPGDSSLRAEPKTFRACRQYIHKSANFVDLLVCVFLRRWLRAHVFWRNQRVSVEGQRRGGCEPSQRRMRVLALVDSPAGPGRHRLAERIHGPYF